MKFGRMIIGALVLFIVSASQAATTDVVCSYAPSQSPLVNRISAGFGGAGTGAAAIMQAAGITAVSHSSGAYILTGSGGYIAGTLGAAVVAPVLITVGVVVAGAAVTVELTCAPVNHPSAIAKVREIAAKFNESARSVNNKAINLRDGAVTKLGELNDKAIDARDAAGDIARVTNNRAVEFRDAMKDRIGLGSL